MSVTETQEDDLVEPSKQIFFVDYTVLEDGLSLLRRQLIDLAEVLFSCFAERYQLKYASLLVNSCANVCIDRDSLTEQYRRQQEEVLLRLAGLGLLNNSFYLAEKYRDYRSMAILTHGYDQEAPAEQRISEYLKTYGKPFVYALYDWYLSKGTTGSML
jgi:nuclear pore complex protein Nup133